MDATHIHLMVNHVPLLAAIFSVLILGWGMIKSNKSFQKLAMVGFIIAGVFSIVALQSGEGAEETVEDLAGLTHDFIHEHEEAAEVTNWVAIIMALAAFAGFGVDRLKSSFMKTYLWVLLVAGGILAGMFSYTAYLGGQIRHTEIRPDASIQQVDTGAEQRKENE